MVVLCGWYHHHHYTTTITTRLPVDTQHIITHTYHHSPSHSFTTHSSTETISRCVYSCANLFRSLGIFCLQSLFGNRAVKLSENLHILPRSFGILNNQQLSSDIPHSPHHPQYTSLVRLYRSVSRETPMMMVSRCLSLSLALFYQPLS